MVAAVLSPIVGVALAPSALSARLIVPIVGDTLAFCRLPASTSFALTFRFCAVELFADLRARSERFTARGASILSAIVRHTPNYGWTRTMQRLWTVRILRPELYRA